MADQIGTIKTPRGITADKFLDMVRAGTHDALVELMRVGTANPSADFYSAVRDGVREAVRATVTAGHLRAVPDSAAEPDPNASAPEGENETTRQLGPAEPHAARPRPRLFAR